MAELSQPHTAHESLGRLLERQRAHAPAMARTTLAERRARLRRLRDAVVARAPEIVAALDEDLRRPHAESEVAEVLRVRNEIAYAIRNLRRWMRPRRVPTPLVLFGASSRIVREPRGVVLVLAPWNYPFGLVLNPLVASIAAGNCTVLKPSEKAPATARLLVSLIGDLFDEREVAVVDGGPDVAQALLDLRFDHIFFTGSTAIGRKVMAAAARHLPTVTLELGGKSPAIVDPTASLPAAARQIVWGKCFNAGQTCLAPDYALVHDSVADRFVSAVRDVIEEFYGATPPERKATPDLARIVDESHYRRLVNLVERSVAEGAQVAIGGDWDAAIRYVAPTVLTGVTPTMAVMQEEIFGPVLPVVTYSDWDEVVAVIGETGKPLASYLFSRDERLVERMLATVPAGGTAVNDTLLHYGSPELPFGGVGSSGRGSYHGYHGFVELSHARPVVRQRLRLTRFLHPPYRGRMHEMTRRLLRWLR